MRGRWTSPLPTPSLPATDWPIWRVIFSTLFAPGFKLANTRVSTYTYTFILLCKANRLVCWVYEQPSVYLSPQKTRTRPLPSVIFLFLNYNLYYLHQSIFANMALLFMANPSLNPWDFLFCIICTFLACQLLRLFITSEQFTTKGPEKLFILNVCASISIFITWANALQTLSKRHASILYVLVRFSVSTSEDEKVCVFVEGHNLRYW